MMKACIICGAIFQARGVKMTCGVKCARIRRDAIKHIYNISPAFRAYKNERQKRSDYRQAERGRRQEPERKAKDAARSKVFHQSARWKQYRAEYERRPLSKLSKKARVMARRMVRLSGLWETQQGRCCYCGCDLNMLASHQIHTDHVLPLAKCGPIDKGNLVLACEACNKAKGDQHPAAFIARRGLAIDPLRLPEDHILRLLELPA